MDVNKSKKLKQLTQTLQREYGIHGFRLGTQLNAKLEITPTGVDGLDNALGIGGIPRGHLTEIWSKPTGGCSTLVLSIIAQAQACNHRTVFIDIQDTFDPESAHQHDVDLNTLVLACPQSINQALDITYELLVGGQVGLIVLGFGLLEARFLKPNLFQRLNLAISHSNCAVICHALSFEHENTNSLSDATSLRLLCEHTKWMGRHGDVTGYTSTVHITKNKFGRQDQTVQFKITLEHGVS